MNDADLRRKLKSVPVPERAQEYWDDFPSRIRVQLRREHQGSAPRHAWRPRLAWAGGLALGLMLAAAFIHFNPLQTASAAITRHERILRGQLAQLDAGLHVIAFNPHGMGYLLAEAN